MNKRPFKVVFVALAVAIIEYAAWKDIQYQRAITISLIEAQADQPAVCDVHGTALNRNRVRIDYGLQTSQANDNQSLSIRTNGSRVLVFLQTRAMHWLNTVYSVAKPNQNGEGAAAGGVT